MAIRVKSERYLDIFSSLFNEKRYKEVVQFILFQDNPVTMKALLVEFKYSHSMVYRLMMNLQMIGVITMHGTRKETTYSVNKPKYLELSRRHEIIFDFLAKGNDPNGCEVCSDRIAPDQVERMKASNKPVICSQACWLIKKGKQAVLVL